uniref:CCHC-type domain-containing protein n=1 Tax=Chrysemys picta bellii TaxID=8478 RepID=A0A8C3HBU2_CHRPI
QKPGRVRRSPELVAGTSSGQGPEVRVKTVRACEEVAQGIREALCPEVHTTAEIIDAIVLEQYLDILPTSTQTWARQHRPYLLAAAGQITEDYLLAAWPGKYAPLRSDHRQAQGAENFARLPKEAPKRPEPTRREVPLDPALEHWSQWVPAVPSQSCTPETPKRRDQQDPISGPLLCFHCGRPGHFSRSCPVMEWDFLDFGVPETCRGPDSPPPPGASSGCRKLLGCCLQSPALADGSTEVRVANLRPPLQQPCNSPTTPFLGQYPPSPGYNIVKFQM